MSGRAGEACRKCLKAADTLRKHQSVIENYNTFTRLASASSRPRAIPKTGAIRAADMKR